MKRYLRFSIAFMLTLVMLAGVFFARQSSSQEQIAREAKIYAALVKNGIEIEQIVPSPSIVEWLTGCQLHCTRFRARVGYKQNQYIYELSKLSRLEELTVVCDRNPTNLMSFDGMANLKILRVSEWYSPQSLDGVQSMLKLEVLKIGDVESPDAIDLTALKNHASLQEFWIDGWQLDASLNFQKLPDW